MSNTPEDFEALRKLLALKRHEQPPPGYFENFSAKVLARIEAADQARPAVWWRRLLWDFEARPAVACATVLVAGGAVLFGLNQTLTDQTDTAALPASPESILVAEPAAAPSPLLTPPDQFALLPPLAGVGDTSTVSSVEAVISAEPPSYLFNGTWFRPQAQPASFTPAGR